jgi:hypothetical protein
VDEALYLLDSHPEAKQVWEKLQADYAGRSFIRKAELSQRITHELPPKNQTLSMFLQRTLQLRAQCRSAGVDDDVLLSACLSFLLALRNTEQFHDWAIQTFTAWSSSHSSRPCVELAHYVPQSDDRPNFSPTD